MRKKALSTMILCCVLGVGAQAQADQARVVLEGPFRVEQGRAWYAEVPAEWTSDNADAGHRSRLMLFEDDVPLGPAHSLHRMIRVVGEGRFSHWNGALLFSTSDNSDPNQNGRTYSVALAESERETPRGYLARPELTRVELEPPYTREGEHAFLASLPADWPGDDLEDLSRSRAVLLEDGRRLGPAHAPHDKIRTVGAGAYSHWHRTLFFSSSDNTDPATNGRRYVVEYQVPGGLGEYGRETFPLGDPFAELTAAERERRRDERAARARELPASAPPTIYWYTIDALRHDVVDRQLAGEWVMPRLREFASEAVRFDSAYVCASNTKLSTASMFTGLWPTRHGVIAAVVSTWPPEGLHVFDLDPRYYTLAELLEDHGYETWTHLYSIWVEPGSGLLQGFARTDLRTNAAAAIASPLPPRWFAYEHILGLHAEYAPSPEAVARFALPQPRAVDPASDAWFGGPLDEATVRELELAYLAEGYDADRELARRLDWLERTGRWDEALVIVTSDHGEEFLEHGRTQHSTQLYEEVVHVPLLVKFPASSPYARHHGSRLPHRVSMVDLYATIAELLGDPELPYEIDGRSLLPILEGAEPDPFARDVVLRQAGIAAADDDAPSDDWRVIVSDGILSGRLKAIFGHRIHSPQDRARFSYRQGDWIAELYDLVDDPDEAHDLASRRDDDFLRLVARHAATLRPLSPDLVPPLDGARPATPVEEPEPVDLDADLLERLEQLGYLR